MGPEVKALSLLSLADRVFLELLSALCHGGKEEHLFRVETKDTLEALHSTF
jgi:hypothetical protein